MVILGIVMLQEWVVMMMFFGNGQGGKKHRADGPDGVLSCLVA